MRIAGERNERAGRPMLVLALAAVAVAIIAAVSWLPAEKAQMTLLFVLLSLALVGALALVALAAGLLRAKAARGGDDVARLLADTSPDGLIVTQGESRIVYANDAYVELASGPLSGAQISGGRAEGLRTVDRLFAGAPRSRSRSTVSRRPRAKAGAARRSCA